MANKPLSWLHYVEQITIKDNLDINFYRRGSIFLNNIILFKKNCIGEMI